MRRYTIWDEMRRMQQQMDELFNRFFTRDAFDYPLLEAPESSRDLTISNYRQPLMDINETDKEIIATIELPGVDKQDIHVNATEDGVEVKVEKKNEKKEEDSKRGLYRIERSYAGFYRYIPVTGIDVDKINASYKNGVLELKMPKLETGKGKKQIKVD